MPTITGLLTSFRDTVNTEFIAHFRTKADGLVGTESEAGTKTVTAAASFSEMQSAVEEVLTSLGENCVNANCSYTALLKSTVNNAMGRALGQSHCSNLPTDLWPLRNWLEQCGTHSYQDTGGL